MTGDQIDGKLEANLEAMKELCHVRMAQSEKYFEEKFRAQDRSVELADKVMQARLESLNELREMVTTLVGACITRAEYSSAHERLREDIIALGKCASNMEGKASMNAFYLALGVSVIGLLLSAVAIFH